MAVPYQTIRLVLSGLITTSQTWSIGLRIAPFAGGNFPTAVNQAILDTWTTNRVVNCRDFWTTSQGGSGTTLADWNSASTSFTGIRSYYYPAGSDNASLASTPAFGSVLAGVGTTPMPAQTCVVASLRSGTPGRSGRGRIYLPATGQSIGADHRYTSAKVTALSTQVAAFLSAVAASQVGGSDIDVVVASRSGARPVLNCVVDNRPDTQRRRADKILATVSATKPVT